MGKSNLRHSGPMKDSWMNRKIHPIWRGVGFVLMILAPIIAFATAEILMDENTRTSLVKIPQNIIVQWQDPLMLAKLILTFFITLVIYAILSMIYFFIARLFGPSRYGPTDVPPVAYKGKSYKR
jgi:hypothetical protein